jgi:hypothetical protein
VSKGPATKESALDNAWRIHDAQLDWTGKADAKAGFAFGLDSAAIATIAILVSTGKVFTHFDEPWQFVAFYLGCAFLVAGTVFASIGVAPRLKRAVAQKQSETNFIYFGHARHWTAEKLEAALRTDDLLHQLARNIVVTADISWKKHVAVNWSIWLTLAGGVCFLGYVIFVRIPGLG